MPGHINKGIRRYWLLHYIVSGKGVFKVDGKKYDVEENQMFIIRPDEMFEYQADSEEPWEYKWVGFSGEYADKLKNVKERVLKIPGYLFDDMQRVADNNDATMTIYVDDVTFSSPQKISKDFREKIIAIVRKYGYQISRPKVKKYTKLYPKLVTGVIIDSTGKPVIKNSMRQKIVQEFQYLKEHPEDEKSRQRLRGLLTAAKQVDPYAFSSISKFAAEKRIDD